MIPLQFGLIAILTLIATPYVSNPYNPINVSLGNLINRFVRCFKNLYDRSRHIPDTNEGPELIFRPSAIIPEHESEDSIIIEANNRAINATFADIAAEAAAAVDIAAEDEPITTVPSIQDPEQQFEEFLAELDPDQPLLYHISTQISNSMVYDLPLDLYKDPITGRIYISPYSSITISQQLQDLPKSVFSKYGDDPKFLDLLSEIHDHVVDDYFEDLSEGIEAILGATNDPIQIDQRSLSQMDLQDLLQYTEHDSVGDLRAFLHYVDSEINRFRTFLEKGQDDIIRIKIPISSKVTVYSPHGNVQKRYNYTLKLNRQKSQEYLYKMNFHRTRLMQIASRLHQLGLPITLNQPQCLPLWQAFDPDKPAVNCPLISWKNHGRNSHTRSKTK